VLRQTALASLLIGPPASAAIYLYYPTPSSLPSTISHILPLRSFQLRLASPRSLAMATALAQPPSALTQGLSESHHQRNNSQSSYSPPKTTASNSENVSPASPRSVWSLPSHLQLQSKQLRPPRSPMYVPAVLRPTEKPVRQSPPTPGQTAFGSPESTRSSIDGSRVTEAQTTRPALTRLLSAEWNQQVLDNVTGPPSRNHWKVSTFDPVESVIYRQTDTRHCPTITCMVLSSNHAGPARAGSTSHVPRALRRWSRSALHKTCMRPAPAQSHVGRINSCSGTWRYVIAQHYFQPRP
jgi:hypothetical protein